MWSRVGSSENDIWAKDQATTRQKMRTTHSHVT